MLDLRVSALIPYRSDGGYREQAWERLVEPRWRAIGAEVIVTSPGDGKHPGDFNHPRAINAAAAQATGELLIIADADTSWTPGLPEALVEAVRGGAAWAMPRHYVALTVTQSRYLVKHGRPGQSVEGLHARAHWAGDSVSWSGLVCVRAEDFHAVGGYDERWDFWGSDDTAFGLTMDTLVGRHQRVEGSALHLWHPAPLAQTYGHEHHRQQYALGEDYKMAAGDVEAMRRVRFAEPRLAASA